MNVCIMLLGCALAMKGGVTLSGWCLVIPKNVQMTTTKVKFKLIFYNRKQNAKLIASNFMHFNLKNQIALHGNMLCELTGNVQKNVLDGPNYHVHTGKELPSRKARAVELVGSLQAKRCSCLGGLPLPRRVCAARGLAAGSAAAVLGTALCDGAAYDGKACV